MSRRASSPVCDGGWCLGWGVGRGEGEWGDRGDGDGEQGDGIHEPSSTLSQPDRGLTLPSSAPAPPNTLS